MTSYDTRLNKKVKLTAYILRMVADAMDEAYISTPGYLRETAAQMENRADKLAADGYSDGFIEDTLLRRYSTAQKNAMKRAGS